MVPAEASGGRAGPRGASSSWIRLLLLTIVSLASCALWRVSSVNRKQQKNERVYRQGEQFPKGSELLPLPNILVFSIFMGTMRYQYTHLTLESMRWNSPHVHHVLIQIIETNTSTEADGIRQLAARLAVPNFDIKLVTMAEWRARVRERLHIDVPFDKTWFYKVRDASPLVILLPQPSSPHSHTQYTHCLSH